MIRTAKAILILPVLLATGCANNSAFPNDSSKGYCFLAEGISGERCYSDYASCRRRESSLRDHYPFTTIQSECHHEAHRVITASSFDKTIHQPAPRKRVKLASRTCQRSNSRAGVLPIRLESLAN